MKTVDGYRKEKYTDLAVLLAGGGAKPLSEFILNLGTATSVYPDYLEAGSLKVNGAATFVNTITGNISGNASYATTAGTANNVAWANTNHPDTFTPSSHTHGNITNAGAIGSTANLPIITTTDGVLTTGSFGTTANTFCQGNDSRLSNSRAASTIGGSTWAPGTNITLTASANSQEWSFDIYRNSKTGCYWHVWDSSLGTMLKVNADDGVVSAPYGFSGALTGNVTGNCSGSSGSCTGNAATATTASSCSGNSATATALANHETNFYMPDNSTARWVRIATLSAGSVGRIYISNEYWYNASIPTIIDIGSSYTTNWDFLLNITQARNTYTTKARIVFNNSTHSGFLEIYTTCRANLTYLHASVISGIDLVTTYTAGEVPDGYTVVKELDLIKGSTISNDEKIIGNITATSFTGALTGNVTGNCSGSSGSCTGNSATATSATSATYASRPNVSPSITDLINAGYLASDYTTRASGTTVGGYTGPHNTEEFLKALAKWLYANHAGYSVFGTINPNARGFYTADIYDSGTDSTTGLPVHITIHYYPHGGSIINCGTSYSTWYNNTVAKSGEALPASDVYAWAKAATKPSYSAADVGLGNVANQGANYYTQVYNSNNITCSSGVTFTQLAAKGNSSVGMIYASTDNPTGSSSWCHTWSQAWTSGTTSSWVSQIALGTGLGTGMWYRCTSGNIAGRAWTKVVDAANYDIVITDLNLSTLAVSGSASFTSTISGSINGNAATATLLLNARTINGVAFNGGSNITITAAPNSHTHGNITNAGAIGSTATLPIITTTNGVLTTGSFGTTAGTFCLGNDSRLSDARSANGGTSDYTSYLNVVASNEIRFNSNGSTYYDASTDDNDLYLNYAWADSAKGYIKRYMFCDGHTTYAKLVAEGFLVNGSSSSYVLTGDGGTAAISGLSVSSASTASSCSGNAATATNADKLDGEHLYQVKSILPGNQIVYSTDPLAVASVNLHTNLTITTAPDNSTHLNNVWYSTGYGSYWGDWFYVTPGETLYMESWIMRPSGATGTAGTFYVGVDWRDKAGKAVNSNSGCDYMLASGSTVACDGTWHLYTKTYTVPTSHTAYSGSDGGGYFKGQIRILVNYSSGTIPTYFGGVKIYRKTPWSTISGAPSALTTSDFNTILGSLT